MGTLRCQRVGPVPAGNSVLSASSLILPQLFSLATTASDACPDEGHAAQEGRRVEALPTWALQGGPQGLFGTQWDRWISRLPRWTFHTLTVLLCIMS